MTRKEPQDDTMFDTRTLQRHRAAGRVSDKEIEAHVASLEDCSDRVAWTSTRMITATSVNVSPTEEESEEDPVA